MITRRIEGQITELEISLNYADFSIFIKNIKKTTLMDDTMTFPFLLKGVPLCCPFLEFCKEKGSIEYTFLHFR